MAKAPPGFLKGNESDEWSKQPQPQQQQPQQRWRRTGVEDEAEGDVLLLETNGLVADFVADAVLQLVGLLELHAEERVRVQHERCERDERGGDDEESHVRRLGRRDEDDGQRACGDDGGAAQLLLEPHHDDHKRAARHLVLRIAVA